MKETTLLINESINRDSNFKKIKCLWILNIILISILIAIIVTIISLYLISIDIKISASPPSILGVGVATLEGRIDTFYKSYTKYQFEFGVKDYYVPNLTITTALNHNSNNVSQFISGLKPYTEYAYRLIAIVGPHYYSSSKMYFKTLSIPEINLTSIVNIPSNDSNNTSVICTGEIKNTGSPVLNYAFQYMVPWDLNFHMGQKFPVIDRFNITYISREINELSSDTWYIFRLATMESGYDHNYHGHETVFYVK